MSEKVKSLTGKSLSEALIFASTKPQYDDRLSITCRTCCVHKLLFLFCFDIKNNFGTQHVLQMLRASEKDLPKQEEKKNRHKDFTSH